MAHLKIFQVLSTYSAIARRRESLKSSQVFTSIMSAYPKQYQQYLITSPLVHCQQTMYKKHFSFEAFGFAIKQFCELPVNGVMELTV